MSGVWERLVQTTKKHLKAVAGDRLLGEFALRTLLTEVESIMNNRPIVAASDDPADLEALTPQSLLAAKEGVWVATRAFRQGRPFGQETVEKGLFLGGESLRRSLRDIVPPQRKKAFMTQLISTVASKQPLYLRVYMALDWRLVMVKKSFCLHFLHTGQERGYERFYNASNDPMALYRIVFSKQEAALMFTRCCGPQDHTDPCKGENLVLSLVHVDHYIERAKEEDDLISVYRWLMVKSLMSQHKSYLVEAWRMLHSVASELEYLCTLNKTLQSLVNEELSKTFRPVLDDDQRTSLLDVAALSTMVTAYGDKLERVLSRGTAITPFGLLPRFRDKLRQVTSTDPVSRSLSLHISSKTPVVLQEINEMLQPLMDAAAHNVHLACPEIHRALKSVEIDVSGRKSSTLPKRI
ncbi:hypothetical protein ACROYT_G010557 [Oculina patagonica]